MTDPTVDALAAERGPCRFDPYYCRAHNGNRHSVIDDRCVADAGYVVVRAEDGVLDRLDVLPRLDYDGADWVQLSDVLSVIKWAALATKEDET